MAYQNIWEEKGLCRIFTDKISGEEILTSNLSLHGDPRFDGIKYVINDFTKITEFEVSDLDITKIVIVDNVAAVSNSYLKIAIVAMLDPLLIWVQLYLERMQDSTFECAIFDNLNDAYKWVSE